MSRWIWPATSLFVCGCGVLADGTWRGEPLAELRGNVVVEEGSEPPAGDLRVALFWAGPDGFDLHEQDVHTELEFPAYYTLTLYSPPPEGALMESDWSDDLVALGAPMLYVDRNGDEFWDEEDEVVLGVSIEAALVYTDGDLEVLADEPPFEALEDAEIDLEDWLEDAETELLDPGFYTMSGDAAICALDSWLPVTRFEQEQVDIFVGDFDALLIDFDCDGDDDEWDELEEEREEDEEDEEGWDGPEGDGL